MIGVDLDIYEEVCEERDKLEGQLAKAKEIMKIGIEGTKLEFLFAGRERPFAEKAKEMLNSFVEEASQFLKNNA